MQDNQFLTDAKRHKKDEFYTQLSDIENELRHYKNQFKGKTIYCNCDDPRVSNFFRYFSLNFSELGLRKLITTCYKSQTPDLFSKHDAEQAICLQYQGTVNDTGVPDPHETLIYPLNGDGDFRSPECIEFLQESDIVVTNPPFSLFSEYVNTLMMHNKQFLIIGNQNAITYKDIFPLIKDERLWLGYGFKRNMAHFIAPNYEDYASDLDHKEGMVRVSGVVWFTNLDTKKRHEHLILYKKYNAEDYPTYDEYEVINVDKVAHIPYDYDGVMGVPITFLDKYNPEQFEILGIANSARWIGFECYTIIQGKNIYNRLLIKRRAS